jgi:hypothetical protein
MSRNMDRWAVIGAYLSGGINLGKISIDILILTGLLVEHLFKRALTC